METYCLDSNIIINLINGKISKEILLKDKNVVTTVINTFELSCWESKNPQKQGLMNIVIKNLKTYELTKEISLIAGGYYLFLKNNKFDTEFKDVLIASICIENNLTLMTSNKKHFEPLQKYGLKLI